MAKILSDAEMAALEQQHAPAKKVLSDDEMQALEASHNSAAPQEQSALSKAADAYLPKVFPLYGLAKEAFTSGNPVQSARVLAEQAGNKASFGHMANIEGAAKALTGPGSYVQGRDESQARMDQEASQMPQTADLGGRVGLGAQAGVALPGISAAGNLGAMGRVAANTGMAAAQGFAQNPGNKPGEVSADLGARGIEALKSGGLAALLSGAFEGVGGAARVLKKPVQGAAGMTESQAKAYVQDPKGIAQMSDQLDNGVEHKVQDQAVQAIDDGRTALRDARQEPANRLSDLLSGKTINVSPTKRMGVSPDADKMLWNKVKDQLPGNYQGMPLEEFQQLPDIVKDRILTRIPKTVPVEGDEINQLKRMYQSEANYAKGTVTDPSQAPRYEAAGKLGSALKRGAEMVGGPGVKEANQELQENITLAQALRQGKKTAPIGTLNTESLDKAANLSRADDVVGTNLRDFKDRIGAAQAMQTTNEPLKNLTRMGGRAALRANQNTTNLSSALSDPATIQALIERFNATQK